MITIKDMNQRSVIILALLFLLIIPAKAQWTALQGPTGAFVNDLERFTTGPAAGTLMMVTNGKLYSSSNNGDQWQEVAITSPAGLYLDDILISGTTMYGLNYSQFWKSTDNGVTWTQLGTEGSFYGVRRMLRFGPDNFFAVYGWNGMFISKDEGATWTKALSTDLYYQNVVATANGDLYTGRWVENTSGNDFNQIVRYPYPGITTPYNEANWSIVYTWSTYDGNYAGSMNFLVSTAGVSSGKIFAVVYDNVLSSPTGNSGTWVTTKTGITDPSFFMNIFAQSTTGDILLFNYHYGNVWRTTNGGTSWAAVTNPTANYGGYVTALGYGGSTIFLGSSGDGVFRSSDNGSTWSLKSNGLFFGQGRQIEVTATGRIIYLNNDQSKGYWTSTDNGVTWAFVSMPQYISRILKLADNKILLYGGNYVYRSDDNGATFPEVENGYYFYSIEERSSGELIGAIYNDVMKSTDKGTTWTAVTPDITGLPANHQARFIAIDNTNNIIYFWFDYADGYIYKLYKAPVGGGAATEITEDPWNDDSYVYVNNMFLSNGKLYVAEYNGFYESSDQGATWKTIGFSGDRVFPITGGLCVSKYGSLYVTQDGGQSWNSTTLPNSNSFINDITPVTGGFMAATANSPALKFTGTLILPVDQLPPYIDFAWQPTEGPYGGVVQQVSTDNALNSYVVSAGVVQKSPSSFTTWTAASPSGYVEDLVIDKASSTLYALQYNTIKRSTNAGVTWTDWNTETTIECRNELFRSATNMVMTTYCTPTKVYVSTNNGSTFGAAKYTVAADHYLESTTVTSTGAIILTIYSDVAGTYSWVRSTDNGTTWTPFTAPLQYAYRFATDNSGNIYATYGLEIHKSSDNGSTWTNISGNINTLGSGGFDFYNYGYVAPNGELWFMGFSNSLGKYGFYKTANNGTTWAFLPTDARVRQVATLGASGIIIATDDGVYSSADNGVTWIARNTGIAGYNTDEIEVISANNVMAITSNSRAFTSSNSQTWSRVNNLTARRFFKNPDGSIYLHSSNSIFKSYDNGVTWSKFASYPSNLQFLTTANGSLYFGAGGNTIRYTLDFITWNTLSVSGLPASFSIQSIAVNSLASVFIVIYNNTNSKYEAYRILFGSAIKFDKPTSPRSLFYDAEAEVVRLYDQQGVIYQTSDGSVWTSRSAPAGDKMIVAQQGYYFIPSYGGSLWLSRNQGQTWQSVGATSFDSNMYFYDVTVNEFTGLAFAAMGSGVIRKSGNIVLPPETTAPVTTSLSPADNATGVSVKPQLTITFSEAVTPVAGKTVRVLDSANPLSPIETMDATDGVQEDKTITFQMSNTLQFNKSYFVIWDAGAFVDVFDNEIVGLSSPTSWNFTTKVGPTLSSTTPTNNGTGVILEPTLTATFSEPMTPVAAKNLRIFKTSDPVNPVATVALQALSSEYAAFIPANPVASQPVKVRFDATKGQQNLLGVPKVFLSSGVVLTNVTTPTSSNITNTRYTEMTKVPGETNLWELSFGASLNSFYGVSPGETIYRVALWFENEGGLVDGVPPATVANGTVNANIVYLNVAAGATPVCSTLPSQSGNSLNFTLCTKLEYSTQYFAKFDAASFATVDGGTLTALTGNTDWVFTTDAPPTVSSTTPAHNATSILNNTQLQIVFSAPVTGVAGKKLYINSSAGVQRTLNAEAALVSGNTLTWDVTPALPYGTQFNVTTDPGTFMGMNTFSKFQANTDWVFTTQNSPAISTLVPADDATNAALTTNLAITFASTVSAEASKNLTVHKASDDAIVATLPVNGATISGNTYTFTLPANALQHNTAYYVMVDENAFNALTTFSKFRNKTDWNFTTVPAPDLLPPTIAFTPVTFTKGATNKLTITVTDNATGSGVDAASIKVKYRGISATTEPVSASMTAGTAANTFEVTVPETWMDELGLEFSFEAKDVNTNTAVSPATGYHKANIVFPETSTLTIPSSVLSAGGGEQNYRIISIPHALGNANIETVFNEFNMDDRASIRLLTYNTSTSTYDNAPDQFSSFTRGVGYWINIKSPTNIIVESATTPGNTKDAPFVLKLKAGWNQIGNPYPFTISWDAVKTAAANTNIGVLKTWNGNAYATDSKLNAFEGGFVFFNGTGEINVNIPLTAKTTPGRANYEPDFGSGWLLPLHISNGVFENKLGGIGMHPNANLSYDEFDDMPLPAFISTPEMKFPHAEHMMKNFTRDVVPMQRSFVWEFNLNPAGDGAVLTWDPAVMAGKANELWLFDESEQKMVNMLTENQYAVYSTKITKFKVYYGIGQGDIMPTRISLGKPFPNPVVSVSRVNFTLPERNTSPYQVTLDVFDLMGRKVQTLAEGEFSPGFYEAEWTLKGGEASGAGVYFYKLTVINGADNIVLTQKILLNK